MASSDRIDELRKKFEENPRRYFAPLANEYRKAGDVEQAISICRDYLPQQPGHMSGHIVYGQALYEGRQFEEAKTVFETALSLDPENLIALRHLGDIALILGDTEGARSWYGRVLEADPRNEEIQAQLKSLEAAAPVPPADEPPTADVTAESETAPTPAASPRAISSPGESAPTVVVSAMKIPEIERTVEQPAVRLPGASSPVETLSTAPTAEITLDNVPMPVMPELEKLDDPVLSPPPAMAVGFEPTSAASDVPSPIEPMVFDAPVPPVSAPPAIDSFTLEGLETTSMTPEAASPASSEVETTATAPLADLPAIDDFRLDEPGAMTSAVEPPAELLSEPPATTPSGPPETAAGVMDLLAMQAPAVADGEPAPLAGPTADLPMLDLGEGGPAPSGAESTALSAPPAAAPAPPTAPVESGPFVTETMAELYLSQGHRDEAVRVYRALLDQRPDDAQLRAKFEKLQADAGPTIRELLAKLARRRPGASPAAVAAAGNGGAADAAPAIEVPAAEPRAPDPVGEAPVPLAEAPAVSSAVPAGATSQTDRIAAMLNAPAPDDAAERAARVLSSAFADGRTRNGDRSASDASAIDGAPARPASKDLSLDAVFGTPESRDAAPASFSFDQFFSQRATADGSPGTASAGGQESRDDVAKFTQWLEGLKQR